jgi:ketosteroid isomerase-like protein
MDGAELMRKVVAGFEKSDLRPLLDAMHDEIVWKTANKHKGLFRFDGHYKGKAVVVDVLAKLSVDYTFRSFVEKEILASEDVVWGLFDVSLAFDPKGLGRPAKDIELEMAIRWKLKDGKIIEHQAFFDTASLLIQQGAMAVPVPQP